MLGVWSPPFPKTPPTENSFEREAHAGPDVFEHGGDELLAQPIGEEHLVEDEGGGGHGVGHQDDHVRGRSDLGPVDLQELLLGAAQLHAVVVDHLRKRKLGNTLGRQ